MFYGQAADRAHNISRRGGLILSEAKKQKIPAKEDIEKLLANYPWISQRTWSSFFKVSSSTLNGWLHKNSPIPEDTLRVIRLLNAVEEKKREMVAKILSTSGLTDFVRFITSVENLAMKSDWMRFFSDSIAKVLSDIVPEGSILHDIVNNKDKDKDGK